MRPYSNRQLIYDEAGSCNRLYHVHELRYAARPRPGATFLGASALIRRACNKPGQNTLDRASECESFLGNGARSPGRSSALSHSASPSPYQSRSRCPSLGFSAAFISTIYLARSPSLYIYIHKLPCSAPYCWTRVSSLPMGRTLL